MSNEIDEILEDDETIEEETQDEVIETKKKGMDLSYLDKDPSEWTTDDAAKAVKATKTLQFQKNHFQNKAKAVKTEAQTLKTNTEQPINLTEEIDIRFLKRDGVSVEDLEQLKFIQAGLVAQGNDASLIDAQANPLYKAYQDNKVREERKNKAQIISSGGETFKDGEKLSNEERESARDEAAKSLLGTM